MKPLFSSLEEVREEAETEVQEVAKTEVQKETEVQEEVWGTDKALLTEKMDSSNSALQRDNVLTRLLKDLMRTSKRSWSRYKKGGLRSCFGVRLARIGSFSGLGC